MTKTAAPIRDRQIRITDPKREEKNRKRLRAWVASIDYDQKPEFSFSFDDDADQLVIHHRTDESAVYRGDVVTLNVRVDMPLNVPSAWPMILLEHVLLIERHEVYERLKIKGKPIYPAHSRLLDFNDDPPVRFEVIDDTERS